MLTLSTHPKSVTLKPRHGYWDVTQYPLGGCFRRAPADGLLISDIGPIRRNEYADHIGRTIDGRRVAFKMENATDSAAMPEENGKPIAPDGFSYETAVKLVADSRETLRACDLFRLFDSVTTERFPGLADYILRARPDLAEGLAVAAGTIRNERNGNSQS